jgi:hypothetical protein
MADEDHWRLPAAYRHVRSANRAGLAWEFLRRNRTFQEACKRVHGYPQLPEPNPTHGKELAPEHWGLLTFRGD